MNHCSLKVSMLKIKLTFPWKPSSPLALPIFTDNITFHSVKHSGYSLCFILTFFSSIQCIAKSCFLYSIMKMQLFLSVHLTKALLLVIFNSYYFNLLIGHPLSNQDPLTFMHNTVAKTIRLACCPDQIPTLASTVLLHPVQMPCSGFQKPPWPPPTPLISLPSCSCSNSLTIFSLPLKPDSRSTFSMWVLAWWTCSWTEWVFPLALLFASLSLPLLFSYVYF